MFSRFGFAVVLAMCLGASTAQAHITLLEPPSWIEEDVLGGPQKLGPCGEGPSDPGTPTGVVTEFQAGETITVEWDETVYHSGHFRIALARDRSELADPAITVDSSCNYAPGSVSGENPQYPVLLDNLFPRTPALGAAETFTQEVTLPDMECEKCTLQVIQFMTNHPPSCIYYHCADIKIVAGDGPPAGGSGGASGTGTGGGGSSGQGGAAAGASGMMTGGTMAPPMMTAGSGAAGTLGTSIGGIGTGGGPSGAAGAGGTPSLPAAGAAGAPAPSAPTSSSNSSSSCSASPHADAGAAAPVAFALALLALLTLQQRRRRGARAR